MALRFKNYIFHVSGHRVDNYSSRYSFLNDERDGAIFIFKDKDLKSKKITPNSFAIIVLSMA